MIMRITAWVVLVSFIVPSCSCVHYAAVTEPGHTLSGPAGRDVEVLSVQTHDGESIDFAEGYPGHIRDGVIEGYVADPVEVTIERDEISRTVRNAGGRIVSVGTKDQRKYWVAHITAETMDSLSFMTVQDAPISIPLAEANRVMVRRPDEAATVGAVIGIGMILFAIAVSSVKDTTIF